MVRELRVFCRDAVHAREVVDRVDALDGVEVQRASDRTFQLHRGGKIEIANKVHHPHQRRTLPMSTRPASPASR